MTAIQWATLISDDAGVIDYQRVRGLVSVILAAGGGIALLGAMLGLLHPSEYVTLGTSAMIAPVTVGKAVDSFAAWRDSKTPPPEAEP